MRPRGGAALVAGLTAALALAVPSTARAWGCAGHVIVARIAEWHLSANARAKAYDLLARNPIDPALRRYCPRIAGDAFADGASWADDVRATRPETAPWHFIDIPRGAQRAGVAAACPAAACVTKAIVAQRARLRAHVSSAKRAEALRFLVHLVGDVHQPLHCDDNGDRGGNCVPVEYLGRSPALVDRASAKYAPNLHQVWDSDVIESELARRHRSAGELASAIDCRFATQIEAWLGEEPDPDAWAWESHQQADAVAYGALVPAVPVLPSGGLASCATGDVTRQMLDLHLAIAGPYEEAAFAVIEQQLARAGARLAATLNAVWP